jgi:16S rRNA (guanine(966)-N(2))-methyltransferase RsmD
MRVISGNARGRRLKAPKGLTLRPTSDRVKEALFNILPHDLTGMKVLDLFAGTGSLTIEALSRGAAAAILVDSSAASARAIRANLRQLDLTERAKVWIMPVSRALRVLARGHETFDMIFLDPPYDRGWIETALKIIAEGALLRPSGVIIAEHSVRERVEKAYGPLALKDQRRYGGTLISFYRPTGEVKPTT